MPPIRRNRHYDTSRRCKIKSIFEYFQKIDVTLRIENKHAIFDVMNVSHVIDHKILNDFDRTRHKVCINETRDRSLIMTRAQIIEANKILKTIEDDTDNKEII